MKLIKSTRVEVRDYSKSTISSAIPLKFAPIRWSQVSYGDCFLFPGNPTHEHLNGEEVSCHHQADQAWLASWASRLCLCGLCTWSQSVPHGGASLSTGSIFDQTRYFTLVTWEFYLSAICFIGYILRINGIHLREFYLNLNEKGTWMVVLISIYTVYIIK